MADHSLVTQEGDSAQSLLMSSRKELFESVELYTQRMVLKWPFVSGTEKRLHTVFVEVPQGKELIET